MFNLFDQEYVTKLYAKEKSIIFAAETYKYKEVGKSMKETVNRIIEKFAIPQERAKEYVKDVWRNRINSEDDDWNL